MTRCFSVVYFYILLFLNKIMIQSTDYYQCYYCCHISFNLANVYDAYNNNNLGTKVYGLKTSNVDYNLDKQ